MDLNKVESRSETKESIETDQLDDGDCIGLDEIACSSDSEYDTAQSEGSLKNLESVVQPHSLLPNIRKHPPLDDALTTNVSPRQRKRAKITGTGGSVDKSRALHHHNYPAAETEHLRSGNGPRLSDLEMHDNSLSLLGNFYSTPKKVSKESERPHHMSGGPNEGGAYVGVGVDQSENSVRASLSHSCLTLLTHRTSSCYSTTLQIQAKRSLTRTRAVRL